MSRFPFHVIAAMRRATKGKPLSAEHRKKLSAAHRARGTTPPGHGRPWTPEEDKLLGTMPDREVAALVGRSKACVWERRERLGIARVALRRRHG